jgi:putative ABC transport system ATP-binding protein
MTNTSLIQIEHLYKRFEHAGSETTVLKDICLDIVKEECIILKGVSGSGKTTLLSLIAAFDKPSSGKILIENDPISKLPDQFASEIRAKKIGMVFQHYNLFEHLSVHENVIIPLIPSGLKMQEITQKASKALQIANISHKETTLASRLSGGEKQRTAIARALVADPSIILCDEPTANLDKENSLHFIEMLKTLHEMGKTIIIATHDPLFDELPFKSRIIPMIDGEIKSNA